MPSPLAPQASGPSSPDKLPATPAPYLRPGSGVFIAAQGSRPEAAGEDADFTVNLEDTDLREVVHLILGELLQENYILDPGVQGVVTVGSNQPVSRDALLPILETLLQMNNAALVKVEQGYKIVPLANAGGEALSVETSAFAGKAGFRLQIIPLKFTAATEVLRILEPYVPEGATVTADAQRNILIVAAPGRDIRDFMETVRVFDVDWLKGMSMGMFPLAYTQAKTMASELEAILGTESGSPLAGLVRFIPIDRLNAILVITQQRRYLTEARKWIEQLDLGGDGPGRRLYIYDVKNGKAEHIAEVLNGVFTQDRGAAAPSPAPPLPEAELAPGLVPVTITSDDAEQPAPAETVASAATSAPAAGQGTDLGGIGSIKIQSDSVNNALLVLALPREYQVIEGAIRRLDVIPRQVLVEATIAEVTLNDNLNYGVQWFIRGGIGGLDATIRSVTGGSVALPNAVAPGLSFALFESLSDVRLFMNALSDESELRVLSSPQVLVIDNQTANIRVGTQVPVTTRNATSAATGDALIQEVEFRDTGVLLTVTPRINAGGLVSMEISQEVSVVGPPVGPSDNVSIDQRTVDSSVVVQSGQTIVLGGLIVEREVDSSTGIPVLGGLPVVGPLFGDRVDDRQRTELIILVTPTVISNAQEALEVTRELRSKLTRVSELERSRN